MSSGIAKSSSCKSRCAMRPTYEASTTKPRGSSRVIDFSITRELPRGFVVEASYVGRMAHRLLQEEDLAMPLDIVDPQSKMDYFGAATLLAKANRSEER